jgi:hypothetical protein
MLACLVEFGKDQFRHAGLLGSDTSLKAQGLSRSRAKTMDLLKGPSSRIRTGRPGMRAGHASIRTYRSHQRNQQRAHPSFVDMDISDPVHLDSDSRDEGEDL